MLKGLATAIIGAIVLLATLGIVLGALLGDTDLFSPATSAAQARSMDAQTQIDTTQAQLEIGQRRAEIAAQQAADALDLEHRAAIYAEERVFLQRQYELQLQQQQQAFEREITMMEVRQIVLLGIGSGAILVITLAVAYYLYACGQANLSQVPQAEGRRRAAESEKEQHARQPASVISRQPTTAKDRRGTPSYQDQQGGNGREPRIRSRGQG